MYEKKLLNKPATKPITTPGREKQIQPITRIYMEIVTSNGGCKQPLKTLGKSWLSLDFDSKLDTLG